MILLVAPYIMHPFPTPYAPLGLGSLSSYLKVNNINSDIVDMANSGLTINGLLDLIKKKKYKYVGFTVNYPNIELINKISDRIKKENKDIKIIYGGPWPSFLSKEILEECPYVDYVVRNEGEITLFELLSNKDLGEINGLTYRDINGIRMNPNRNLIGNINTTPSPYLSNAYDLTKYKIGTIITNRGCPQKCSFCSARKIFFDKVRSYELDRVLKEVDLLYSKGIREYVFIDDSFFIYKGKARTILKHMEENCKGSSIECQIRFDAITDESLTLMKKAGVQTLNLGLETSNEDTLKKIKKATDPKMIKAAMDKIREYGIKSVVNLIIGLPNEKEEDVFRTIKFAKEIKADVYVWHIIRLYPGTEMTGMRDELGMTFIDDEKILLRRSNTVHMTYEKMWDLMELANDKLGTKSFYKKILTAEQIDIENVHPMRCLL